MRKVLITGASGLLGRAVHKAFSGRSDWEALGLAYSRTTDNLRKVDLTDEKQIQKIIEEFKPSIIIHSAAIRRPDEIENQAEKSHALNVESTESICRHASKIGCPVVYISTDYVFDGTCPPYGVDAKTNPINKYGISKLEGERLALEVSKGNLVLRVAVLYGKVENLDESAVTCLFTTVMNTNKEKSISDYEIKYPTHVEDVALVLLDLCTKKLENPGLAGVYHYSGDEKLTKYEQSCIMGEVFGLPTSHMVPDRKPSPGAPRPVDPHLDTSRLEEQGIHHQRKFREAIRSALEPFFKR